MTKKITLWLIVFACLSVTLPTAFMSTATALLMVFWLLSANYKSKFDYIKANPAALAAVALFILYALGTTYSSAPWGTRLDFLTKYDKLLLIPLVISALDSEKYRQYALNAFLMGMLFVLSVSYLKWLGIVPHTDNGQGYIVFNARISHSILMSFAMFMMMNRAVKSAGSIKIFWVILSVLAGLNILFLVNGRTGQITMMALLVLFTYEKWGKKSFIYWLSVLLAGFALYQVTPAFFPQRLSEIKQEIQIHQNHGDPTSSGIRVDMYQSAISLIKQHPFIGGGTGSFENEYAAIAKDKNLSLTRVTNPHNQFILTTQELGIPGLIFLILMWSVHWRVSYEVQSDDTAILLRGLIVTIVIGSLFNSLLLDAGEGKFYCVLAGVLLSAYKSKKYAYEA